VANHRIAAESFRCQTVERVNDKEDALSLRLSLSRE
jgi:hypothetical protein